MNILKKAHCGKVSTHKKETLTYNIGNIDSEYYFRVTDNASGGYFSNEWVSLNDVTELLPNETPLPRFNLSTTIQIQECLQCRIATEIC